MTDFDRDYYENGRESGKSCYEDYKWMPEMTIPMIQSVMDSTGISKGDIVLDYGCAKGYCVKAFRELGVEAYGADISQYAIQHADPEIYQYLTLLGTGKQIPQVQWDWFFCKDVLEHLDECTLSVVLDRAGITFDRAFIVVPLGRGDKYFDAENDKDITHLIRQDRSWWAAQLGQRWDMIHSTYKFPGMKERFEHPYAHGFFTCTNTK